MINNKHLSIARRLHALLKETGVDRRALIAFMVKNHVEREVEYFDSRVEIERYSIGGYSVRTLTEFQHAPEATPIRITQYKVFDIE